MSSFNNTPHSKGIKDIALPDYVPSLPPNFTFQKTNLYQIPSFVNGISSSINTLNDSDNLYKLEETLKNVLKERYKSDAVTDANGSDVPTTLTPSSIIPNKSIYLNYHLTPNNEYFLKNLPSLNPTSNNGNTGVDILSIIQKKKKQAANREIKHSKLKNNWKRNVFNNMNNISAAQSFDIKLANDKFTSESYLKMEKLKLKKINKFKENESTWQKMKLTIYTKLRDEEHLLKQLEVEERREKEMQQLKVRQQQEDTEREHQHKQPKMVFKLLPSVKKEDVLEDEPEAKKEAGKEEFWVSLKYKAFTD